MLYNYGEAEALPSFVIEYTPPEDQAALATIVATLSNAGFKADAAELSKRFGLKLRYEATSNQGGMAFAGNAALSAESTPDGLRQWLNPVYEELLKLGDDELSKEEFQAKLSEVCTNKDLFGNSEMFEKALEELCQDGIAVGVKKSQRSLKNE